MADPTPELKGVLDKIAEGEKGILALLEQQKTATDAERKALDEKIAVADKSLEGVRGELKVATEKYEKQGTELGEAKSRIDDIERRLGRPGLPARSGATEGKTIGQMFTELLVSGGSLDRMKSTNRRESDALMLQKAIDEIMAEHKATLALTDTTNFAPVYRAPMVRRDNERRPVLRQLMNTVRTMQNAIQYVEILGFGPETQSGTVSGIVEASGVATVTTGAAHGLQIGDRIEISGATGVTAYNTVHFVHTVPSTTTLTIQVTSGIGNPGGTIVWRNMRGGAAATVAEGNAKPEARMKVTEKTANVQTIAHWLPATRQVLDDVAQIRSIIDNKLLLGLENALETKLFYGTGGSGEIQGILTHVNRQRYVGTADTYSLDAIRKGVTRVQMAEAEPTLCIVNPLDWERMEITKSATDDHYVLTGGAAGSEARLWRVPILITPRIALNTALIGDFSMAATLYDRESASIRFSESHASYFTSNLLAILAEMRMGVSWEYPEAFCEITLPAAV